MRYTTTILILIISIAVSVESGASVNDSSEYLGNNQRTGFVDE